VFRNSVMNIEATVLDNYLSIGFATNMMIYSIIESMGLM